MKTIVYITCPGHSGSTLLDMLIGTHPSILSTGELVHLPNQYYRNQRYDPTPSNGLICSCLYSFYECSLWKNIFNYLNLKLGYDLYKNPLKFKIAFLMKHSIPHQSIWNKIIRRILVFSIINHLNIIDWILIKLNKHKIQNNILLYKSLWKLTSKEIIIDSTKDPIRLHFLLKADINVKVIVLRRNILGVSASGKKLNINPINSAKLWLKFYHEIKYILEWNNIKPLYVNYEDVIDNTTATLNKIFKFIGVNKTSKAKTKLNGSDYHLVAGNGLRYKSNFEIINDEIYKKLLTLDEQQDILELQHQKK